MKSVEEHTFLITPLFLERWWTGLRLRDSGPNVRSYSWELLKVIEPDPEAQLS